MEQATHSNAWLRDSALQVLASIVITLGLVYAFRIQSAPLIVAGAVVVSGLVEAFLLGLRKRQRAGVGRALLVAALSGATVYFIASALAGG